MDNKHAPTTEENAAMERLALSEDWTILKPFLLRVRAGFQDALCAPKSHDAAKKSYPDDVLRGFISGVATLIGRVETAGKARETREAATRVENQRDRLRDLQTEVGRTAPFSPGPNDTVKRAAGE